jgi:hypothetical protein
LRHGYFAGQFACLQLCAARYGNARIVKPPSSFRGECEASSPESIEPHARSCNGFSDVQLHIELALCAPSGAKLRTGE